LTLPELIEIVPPVLPAPARLSMPGSKSITNRALVLAALADGETRLKGALWSEDTVIMVEALRSLGFDVKVEPDAAEESNRTITVRGLGGVIRNGGNEDEPLEIYTGNAGTAARFLMALLCLGKGIYRLYGTPRMHERPQGALVGALRQLGYYLETSSGHLPIVVHAGGPRPGPCEVSVEESSQFASALLLSSEVGGWQVSVTGHDAEESAYVAMTSKLMQVFPKHGGEFQIEPDCSSASYFLAAGALLPNAHVQIEAWPESDWQIDARFMDFVQRSQGDGKQEWRPLSRLYDLGDSIMTAIVMAPLLPTPLRFIDLGRLRLQESERVRALRDELSKCGARVIESGDTLEVYPSRLHGAEIETYDDHRIAMCFAVLGLKVPGMRIRNPACVKKTYPNFFARLAAPSPQGLGATIRDVQTGKPLTGEELLAV
jgi:3-phosphoshikimate 1-carboxyvinyltransferase